MAQKGTGNLKKMMERLASLLGGSKVVHIHFHQEDGEDARDEVTDHFQYGVDMIADGINYCLKQGIKAGSISEVLRQMASDIETVQENRDHEVFITEERPQEYYQEDNVVFINGKKKSNPEEEA